MSEKLEALIARLRNCKPGETYPLDPFERELILGEMDSLRAELGIVKGDLLDDRA